MFGLGEVGCIMMGLDGGVAVYVFLAWVLTMGVI